MRGQSNTFNGRRKPGYHLRLHKISATLRAGDSASQITNHQIPMTHSRLVDEAVRWLRIRYRCGIVLSEQSCSSGETPDAIGWKRRNHSVVIECKISRADFLADAAKAWRVDPECGLGCERYYLVP